MAPVGSWLFSSICVPFPTTKEVLPGLGSGRSVSQLLILQRVARLPLGGCTLDASAPGLESGLGVSCSVIILPEQGQGRSSYPLVFHECMHHSIEAHDGHVRNPKKYNIGAEEQVINLLS